MAIAVTGPKRLAALPDVQTVSESAIFPAIRSSPGTASRRPRARPSAILDRLNADLRKTMASPDVKEKLANIGGDLTVNVAGGIHGDDPERSEPLAEAHQRHQPQVDLRVPRRRRARCDRGGPAARRRRPSRCAARSRKDRHARELVQASPRATRARSARCATREPARSPNGSATAATTSSSSTCSTARTTSTRVRRCCRRCPPPPPPTPVVRVPGQGVDAHPARARPRRLRCLPAGQVNTRERGRRGRGPQRALRAAAVNRSWGPVRGGRLLGGSDYFS